MKKYPPLILTMAFMLTSVMAIAYPLSDKQSKVMQQNEDLRSHMDKMILSVADMDFMVNRFQELDYEILEEDATRILNAIKKIRELDTTKSFTRPLHDLEVPAKKLLKYSKKKDPRAKEFPEQIFNACFKCHTQNRKW